MNNKFPYPRGSEWRKWDLHVHTPASFDHNYRGSGKDQDVWEVFIKDLESLPPEFKVLGINDYLFIDGYQRLCKEKEKNGRIKNIDLLLPVIEFRMNKFAGTESKLSKVHFHVIFSPDIKSEIIQQHFLNAIPRHYVLTPKYAELKDEWQALATRESLEELGKKIKANVSEEKLKDYGSDLQEGFNNITFDEAKITEVLDNSHYFKGKYFTAVGKTEWADIKWTDQSVAEKKDVINKVEFVFISSETVNDYEKSKKQLTDSLVNDLLLDCSDAHNFSSATVKDRIGKCFTWIKADPSFEGLKQIMSEPKPNDRVFVGSKPPKLVEIENNKSKYIDLIKINHTSPKETGGWFSDEIFLNTGLVAVIGRKGSGKSAFTDIIGLCGNSKINAEYYSFLTKEKFRNKRGFANKYEATLRWQGVEYEKAVNLDSEVDIETEIEKVKYLPQKFVENICNENGVSILFQQEIDKVIFAYVPEENRLGTLALDELIKIKTEAIKERLAELQNQLNGINIKIVMLEKRQKKEHADALNKKLKEKCTELSVLSEPKEVKRPKTTLSKGQQGQFDKITQELETVENDIVQAKKSLSDANNKTTKLARIKSAISQIKSKRDELIAKIQEDAKTLVLNPLELIKLTIDEIAIISKETELNTAKKNLEAKLDENNPESEVSLYNKRTKLIHDRDEITKAFTAEQKAYDEYLEEIKKFKARQGAIEGKEDDNTLETIKSLEKEIAYLALGLEKELQAIKEERTKLSKQLYQELKKKIEFYKDVYHPLTKFIEEEKKNQEKSGTVLSFDVGIVFSKQSFADDFFTFIDRKRDGSFQNIERGQKVLERIMNKYEFDVEEDAVGFAEDMIDHLNNDKTKTPAEPVNLRSQIKGGDDENIRLYNFLFGFGYLEVKYKVLFNEKDLNTNEFSPGEKGALLLIFYLLIDREKIPLVMDQPEENLDNESVYTLLVPYIKKAKQKRQIIVVTHNPNLAVVCNAEQIVCAQMDKLNNQIRYTSGSIENPATNKRIVDILEGTMPAFTIRGKKYIK